MLDFTVIICTYNGAHHLPAVLDALRAQKHTSELHWEVLIVDNNSSDDTALIVKNYQTQEAAPLIRYCFEPQQGLAFARRRAVDAAMGSLLGFLDDDTVPSQTWVSAAYQFAQEHPNAGAFGSEILGQFEVEPPPNFHRIEALLALVKRGSQPFQYATRRGVLPAGAGMVIRRDIWLKYVPQKPVLAGVYSTSLAAKGEDVETLSYIRQAGYSIWHNPNMKIWHRIPAKRLTPDYLSSLCRAVGLNRYPLRMLSYPTWQRPIATPLHVFSDTLRLVTYISKNLPLLYQGDVVARCELQLRWYTLISFLYFSRQDRSR